MPLTHARNKGLSTSIMQNPEEEGVYQVHYIIENTKNFDNFDDALEFIKQLGKAYEQENA